MEDTKEAARLRQSQIFAASHVAPKKRENEHVQKSGAAKLLEKKQKMFDLQEALEEEKLRFAEKVFSADICISNTYHRIASAADDPDRLFT